MISLALIRRVLRTQWGGGRGVATIALRIDKAMSGFPVRLVCIELLYPVLLFSASIGGGLDWVVCSYFDFRLFTSKCSENDKKGRRDAVTHCSVRG